MITTNTERSTGNVLAEAIYHLGYNIALFGGFILIIVLMLYIPIFILASPFIFYHKFGIWGMFGALIIDAIIVIGIAALLQPWRANDAEVLEKEQTYTTKVFKLFPDGLAAYKYQPSPLHLFPFVWRSYCPSCHERVHIEIWNTFRYTVCNCKYRWTAQDNFIG